jgi:hypothetical protein
MFPAWENNLEILCPAEKHDDKYTLFSEILSNIFWEIQEPVFTQC